MDQWTLCWGIPLVSRLRLCTCMRWWDISSPTSFGNKYYFLMNVFTASRIPSHMLFVFFELRSVRCTPPCPTIVLWYVAIRLYCSVVIGLCVRIAAIIPVLGGSLFIHRRDIASTISFYFPGIYPIVYSSSCRAIRYLPTISFLSLSRNVRFLWSVRIVNLRSRSSASRWVQQ